ncbi:hypothetical protein [Paractinoplanes durhamensis]|uniref:hypothetical protein n=1 Tax=Paractinoplanes durhamensis TaxID=113563 RepID=UPI00194106A7|nr:hypothetical protein [Actinoplanes durhamensis]
MRTAPAWHPPRHPPPGNVTANALTKLTGLVGTLTRYGDASVVAAAMTSRGEARRADLVALVGGRKLSDPGSTLPA